MSTVGPKALCDNPPVLLTGLDTAAVARALAQIAEQPNDFVEAYFERLEEIELPPEEDGLGPRARREEGLAVRLIRERRTWLASRDNLSATAFTQALRQVARALPQAAYAEPGSHPGRWTGVPAAPELAPFPAAVAREIRKRHVAFPLRLTLKRHRRWVQVVGPRLVPPAEQESFYSLAADLPWGRFGSLLPALGAAEADQVGGQLAARFRARQAAPPAAGTVVAVLAPPAAAVFLHEAVAHALEADVLAMGGNPESAVGVQLGHETLSVLDDPGSSPGLTRRETDDEGSAVCRRWLLRRGAVAQPLADVLWAGGSDILTPGAGRRANRLLPPSPRSSHLEVLPGDASEADLLSDAEHGLAIPEASRGHLDPITGQFVLWVPYARRIRGGLAADTVGPFRLRGTIASLLAGLTGIGNQAAMAGAGWCAKGGQVLPVWATTPSLRLEGVEVLP